jgi:hypothetical protein
VGTVTTPTTTPEPDVAADQPEIVGPVVVVFEVLSDDVPGRVRLKRYLKLAGRGYKLKCVHIGYRLPAGHVCNADPPVPDDPTGPPTRRGTRP